MAKRKRRPTCQPTHWFISACRPLGHPNFGYWEFWDGEKWAGEFVKTLLFTDLEECAKTAERVNQETGVDTITNAAGPEVGGVFVAMNCEGKFWLGTGWGEAWEEARQWTAEPTTGTNMVRCADPWKGCHDECERLRAEQEISCSVAYIPQSKWVSQTRRRYSVPCVNSGGGD
jgi:hypothetical protein